MDDLQIAGYLDGRLAHAERRAVESFLESDGDFRQTVEAASAALLPSAAPEAAVPEKLLKKAIDLYPNAGPGSRFFPCPESASRYPCRRRLSAFETPTRPRTSPAIARRRLPDHCYQEVRSGDGRGEHREGRGRTL